MFGSPALASSLSRGSSVRTWGLRGFYRSPTGEGEEQEGQPEVTDSFTLPSSCRNIVRPGRSPSPPHCYPPPSFRGAATWLSCHGNSGVPFESTAQCNLRWLGGGGDDWRVEVAGEHPTPVKFSSSPLSYRNCLGFLCPWGPLG